MTSLKRSPSAPDIPTLAEQGLPGFDADSRFAIFAPAHLPKELQDKLNAEANRVYSLPDVQAKMKTLGWNRCSARPSGWPPSSAVRSPSGPR